MIAAIEFNRGLSFTPVTLKEFDYPAVNWKYASLEHVMKHSTTNDTLKQIVSQCPIRGNHKRILIDVKVQNLVPSQTSCIPGWHLDGPGNPLHKSLPEVHHLYIHEEGGETEFIANSFNLPITIDMNQKKIVDIIPEDVKITKCKFGNFTTFTRFDFHRGIKVKTPMKRLLVRISETDVILPRNQPFLYAKCP